jgi:hypothetical protein
MVQRRIPRPGSPTTDLRALKTYVSIAKWNEVMDRAEKSGLSASRYINALIDRDQLNSEGRPVWADPPMQRNPLPGLEDPAA